MIAISLSSKKLLLCISSPGPQLKFTRYAVLWDGCSHLASDKYIVKVTLGEVSIAHLLLSGALKLTMRIAIIIVDPTTGQWHKPEENPT